jgi:hypothetical protein
MTFLIFLILVLPPFVSAHDLSSFFIVTGSNTNFVFPLHSHSEIEVFWDLDNSVSDAGFLEFLADAQTFGFAVSFPDDTKCFTIS